MTINKFNQFQTVEECIKIVAQFMLKESSVETNFLYLTIFVEKQNFAFNLRYIVDEMENRGLIKPDNFENSKSIDYSDIWLTHLEPLNKYNPKKLINIEKFKDFYKKNYKI